MNEDKVCGTTTKPSKPKELEEIYERIDSAQRRANELGETLFNFNDRINGCIPQNDKSKEEPCREGLIGIITDKLDSLDEALNKIDNQAHRANGIG